VVVHFVKRHLVSSGAEAYIAKTAVDESCSAGPSIASSPRRMSGVSALFFKSVGSLLIDGLNEESLEFLRSKMS
jgi:hypothetical protein